MTAADDAYYAIRQRVRDDARKAGVEIREKSSAGLSSMTVFYAEPLAGIKMARTYERAAARLAAEYVSLARKDGAGWLEIGKALGLAGDSDYDVMVAAYERSRSEDGLGVPLPYWFTCGTCGQQITDRGPYSTSPLDQEEGHREDCRRMADAVRAYRALWGEED